jgi:predicted membrane protein
MRLLDHRKRDSKMEGTSLLNWGMVFGAIGLGFFAYGKKQKAIVPLVSGIALFIFPYLIANVYILVIVGALLVVLPYFVRI